MLKRTLLALTACLLMVPFLVTGQVPETVTTSYTWTYPTTGSPVVLFVVQLSSDGGAWETVTQVTDNRVILELAVLEDHQVRVAAQDALQRQGIWSGASLVYTPDNGAPGGCGTPEREQ